MTDPATPLELALFEFLAVAVEGQGNLPPGLNVRVLYAEDLIEVLSRGRVIATIARSALLERADTIRKERQ
jgi:hypothetical protein